LAKANGMKKWDLQANLLATFHRNKLACTLSYCYGLLSPTAKNVTPNGVFQ
jgi:hypothetical protein